MFRTVRIFTANLTLVRAHGQVRSSSLDLCVAFLHAEALVAPARQPGMGHEEAARSAFVRADGRKNRLTSIFCFQLLFRASSLTALGHHQGKF